MSAKPRANNMELDCPLAGLVTSAVQVNSKPTSVTESTSRLKALKSKPAEELIKLAFTLPSRQFLMKSFWLIFTLPPLFKNTSGN